MIALDRTPPEQIAADIERFGIDPRQALARRRRRLLEEAADAMRESLPELRELLPGVRLVLAAMGPKMCALAGSEYDGVFFNWMTPGFAAGAREKVEAGAAEAGRETPPVFGYVRTAVGPDAAERLAKEESFYRDLHKGYRDHFDRLGEPEGTVGVAAAGRRRSPAALAAYTALDTIVVRGLAQRKVEPMTAVAEPPPPTPSATPNGACHRAPNQRSR